MDSARVYRRIPGVEKVTISYRRSETEMPARAEPGNIVEVVLVIADLDAVLEALAQAGQLVVHQDLLLEQELAGGHFADAVDHIHARQHEGQRRDHLFQQGLRPRLLGVGEAAGLGVGQAVKPGHLTQGGVDQN